MNKRYSTNDACPVGYALLVLYLFALQTQGLFFVQFVCFIKESLCNISLKIHQFTVDIPPIEWYNIIKDKDKTNQGGKKMKKVKVTIIELGKEVDTVIELRRDISELASELNISNDVALKLAVMEVLNDDWKSPCTCTFKNWKNKRIYFTTSNGSNRSNGRQRYYDLETNELIDQGLDYFSLKSIQLGLSTIREA